MAGGEQPLDEGPGGGLVGQRLVRGHALGGTRWPQQVDHGIRYRLAGGLDLAFGERAGDEPAPGPGLVTQVTLGGCALHALIIPYAGRRPALPVW